MNKKEYQKINKEINKYLSNNDYSFKERLAFYDGCVFALDLNIEELKGGYS